MIGKLKKRFTTHGIPNTFHSDNEPPFNFNEFSARDHFTGASVEQRQSQKCSKDVQRFDEESC